MSRGKIVIQLSSTLFEGIKSAARETKLHRNFYATQVIESDLRAAVCRPCLDPSNHRKVSRTPRLLQTQQNESAYLDGRNHEDGR